MIKELKNSQFLKHKTFGLPEDVSRKFNSVSAPDKYLKKDDGIRRHYERPKTSHPQCNSRRPPVPKHNEHNVMHTMGNENKNFKLINIKRAKTAKPRTLPSAKCFEQQTPIYIYKPKYGKVPKYLQNLKEVKTKSNEMKSKEEFLRNERDQNQIRVVDEEEKKELLDGLKHNWQKLQEEYQKMPLLIDSVPKMIRKTKLENNLKSLEQDICLLNTNSNRIFILPDKKRV